MTGARDVTIDHSTHVHGPSDQLVERYVDELMLTKEAVAALFGALERERPGLTDLDGELRKLAKEFKELKASLRDTAGDDREVADLKRQAADALERGEFDSATTLLQEAKTFAHVATVQSGQTHDEKRLAEAEVAAELGRLALTRVRYAEAATHMREAIDLMPAGHDETRATYLIRLGTAEWRSGRYREAVEAEERALEARERALGPGHPGTTMASATSPRPIRNSAAIRMPSHSTSAPSPSPGSCSARIIRMLLQH